MRVPRGEELRREALEARRVFAEQSLRMLPRVRRLAREFWGLAEALERKYRESVGEAWRLLQLALIEDVECYLKALDAKSIDDLLDVAVECYERLRPLSDGLRRALEWLKMGYVNEVRRGYFVDVRVEPRRVPPGVRAKPFRLVRREYMPADLVNELVREAYGYARVKERAVKLSLRAGMEPPEPCGELESLLRGAWGAYMSLRGLQRRILIHYPERAYAASVHLECAVEVLGHLSRLVKLVRGEEGRVAGLEACEEDGSCSPLECAELAVGRRLLQALGPALYGTDGRGFVGAHGLVVQAALELLPLSMGWGGAPTYYYRLLDGFIGMLLDWMLEAVGGALSTASEVSRALGRDVRERELRALQGCLLASKAAHERGPIRSILRIREEQRKEMLEGGCSTIERLLIERGIL